MLTRACLLVFVSLLAASAGSGQPTDKKKQLRPPPIPADRLPAGPPFDTAFPDLKPRIPDEKYNVPDLPLPPFPVLAADAPMLRKVQYEQLREGLSYLYRVETRIQLGAFDQGSFREYLLMTEVVFRAAAELEDTPAKRVPWYETRVRILKELERFTKLRVDLGGAPPQDLHSARFARLQAEADLLKLKAEAEKAVPAVVAPVVCAPVAVPPRLFRRR